MTLQTLCGAERVNQYSYVEILLCIEKLNNIVMMKNQTGSLYKEDLLCVYTHTCIYNCIYTIYIPTYTLYIYISRIQNYLLIKIALRFLSRIPKIYVDPRGIAQGVPP